MSECIRNIVIEHRNKTGVITMHSRGWFPMTRNSLMEHSSLYIRKAKDSLCLRKAAHLLHVSYA